MTYVYDIGNDNINDNFEIKKSNENNEIFETFKLKNSKFINGTACKNNLNPHILLDVRGDSLKFSLDHYNFDKKAENSRGSAVFRQDGTIEEFECFDY